MYYIDTEFQHHGVKGQQKGVITRLVGKYYVPKGVWGRGKEALKNKARQVIAKAKQDREAAIQERRDYNAARRAEGNHHMADMYKTNVEEFANMSDEEARKTQQRIQTENQIREGLKKAHELDHPIQTAIKKAVGEYGKSVKPVVHNALTALGKELVYKACKEMGMSDEVAKKISQVAEKAGEKKDEKKDNNSNSSSSNSSSNSSSSSSSSSSSNTTPKPAPKPLGAAADAGKAAKVDQDILREVNDYVRSAMSGVTGKAMKAARKQLEGYGIDNLYVWFKDNGIKPPNMTLDEFKKQNIN